MERSIRYIALMHMANRGIYEGSWQNGQAKKSSSLRRTRDAHGRHRQAQARRVPANELQHGWAWWVICVATNNMQAVGTLHNVLYCFMLFAWWQRLLALPAALTPGRLAA